MSRDFRDSQPCPVAVESSGDAVRRAQLPRGRKLAARSTPVPQLPPALAEQHPMHRCGPSGSDGHVGKGQSSPKNCQAQAPALSIQPAVVYRSSADGEKPSPWAGAERIIES